MSAELHGIISSHWEVNRLSQKLVGAEQLSSDRMNVFYITRFLEQRS
jgi:hypothetical protein